MDAEQQGLEKLIKRHQVGQQIALRARIVLAASSVTIMVRQWRK